MKNFLAPTLIFLAAFALCLQGLNPSFYMDDSPEIITAAATLGIAHPPGYPLYTLLGRLLSLLPFGTWGFRVNLLAALSGSLTCALLFHLLRDRFQIRPSLAAPFALIWMAGATAYPAALSAKNGIYQLTAVFLLAILSGLFRGRRLPAIFLFGLSLTNHWMSMVPCLAGFAWLYYVQYKGRPFPAKELLQGAALLVIGLSLYLYLPLRSHLNPLLDWAHPVDVTNFWHHVTRYVDKHKDFTPNPLLWMKQALFYLKSAFVEFNGLALLAIAGMVLAWRNDRTRALGILLTWAGLLGALCVYSKFSSEKSYLMQNYSIASLALVPFFAGLGYERLRDRVLARKPNVGGALTGLAWVLAALLIALQLPKGGQRFYTYSYDYVVNAWRSVPRGGLFFCKGDVLDFPAWYLQILEGKRPDLPVLGGGSLPMDWYRIYLARTQKDLTVPYPLHEKGKEYISGHLMRWMVEKNPGRRLFFTFPDLAPEGLESYWLIPNGLTQEAFAPGAKMAFDESRANALWQDMRLRHFQTPDDSVDTVTWDNFLKDYGAARSWMMTYYLKNARPRVGVDYKAYLRKALSHLFWAQAWDPKNAAYAMNAALVETHLGEKEKALDWFKKALEIEPGNAYYFFMAGSMASNLGEKEKADIWLREAARLDPENKGIPNP